MTRFRTFTAAVMLAVMRITSTLIYAMLSLAWAQTSHADVGCLPNKTFETIDFAGEVFGRHAYTMDTGFRRLHLNPVDGGWKISVFRADGSSAPTIPPAHGVSQSGTQNLFLKGQDFWSETHAQSLPGNTIRKFLFGNHVIDPAMNPERLVPGQEAPNIATVEPTPGEQGLGELIIEDIGLSDLNSGQTPRLTYVKFSGCLGWHRGHREPDWRLDAEPGVPDDAVRTMRQCGFDARLYRLSDRTTGWSERGSQAYLEPDFLSEGVRDMVVPAIRIGDGKAGLALCQRGDNTISMIGFDGNPDVSAFMDDADYWHIDKSPHKPGPAISRPAGDQLIIGFDRGPRLSLFIDLGGTIHVRRESEQ